MTAAKVSEMLELYEERLWAQGVVALRAPHDLVLDLADLAGRNIDLAHCLEMIPEIRGFLKQGRMEKTFRWLGFLQGVLWTAGIFSIDELKNHNRPNQAES
jgi:hypothetical protein